MYGVPIATSTKADDGVWVLLGLKCCSFPLLSQQITKALQGRWCDTQLGRGISAQRGGTQACCKRSGGLILLTVPFNSDTWRAGILGMEAQPEDTFEHKSLTWYSSIKETYMSHFGPISLADCSREKFCRGLHQIPQHPSVKAPGTGGWMQGP